MKKLLATLVAISMMAISMTACGGSDTSTEDEDTTTTVAETEADAGDTSDGETDDTSADDSSEEVSEADVLVLPDGVKAEDGDAYLAFGDEQWWLQYDGADDKPLSYGATVVHIDGEGTYTVGLDASNDDAVYMNGVDSIGGCSFCGVIIQNGEALFPDQPIAITIDKVTIDGVDVELVANNYTNYEDGNLRANVYNPYVEDIPTEDVWTASGSLDNISPMIVPEEAFSSFSTIEITFTISNTGDATASAGDTSEAEADTSEGDVETDAETADDASAEAETNPEAE
jgi:hypothetical protein